jgi:predicted Zn-dependent protease
LLRAVAIAPEFPETYKTLASLYHGLGRIADAWVVQRRLVEIEPQRMVNHVNLANLATRLGDMASAEGALKRAIELRPDASVAYSCLAQLYLKTGKPEQARSLAREAVSLEATAAGYALLASACRQLDDNAGAEAAFREAEKLATGDSRTGQIDTRRP